jgi:superfamily II DNA/RNA helicase
MIYTIIKDYLWFCCNAGMQQRARLKALERFRADDTAVLVASDVAARGLDIPVSPSACGAIFIIIAMF